MMKRLVLLIAALFWAGSALAIDISVHGAVKNETAYFVSGDKRFDKIQNRLDVKP